jgi:hypothetical protein
MHAHLIALHGSAMQMNTVGCELIRAGEDGVPVFLLQSCTSWRGMVR